MSLLTLSAAAFAQANPAEKEVAKPPSEPGAAGVSTDKKAAKDGGADPAAPDKITAGSGSKDKPHSLVKDLLQDQKSIWISPFHLNKSEAKWAGALTATTAIMLLTDRPAPLHHGHSEDILETSNGVSKLGEGYSTFGFAGGLYLIGKLTKNDHARETGLLATEALLNTAIVTSTLKVALRRERPYADSGKGEFWSGGSSFPSGHAGSAWALATVVAGEYKDNAWVRVGAYGYAAAVSVARFTGRNHFASDVVVGSAIGYFTGRLVLRKHSSAESHKKVTAISPYVNQATRTYGMQGSITF